MTFNFNFNDTKTGREVVPTSNTPSAAKSYQRPTQLMNAILSNTGCTWCTRTAAELLAMPDPPTFDQPASIVDLREKIAKHHACCSINHVRENFCCACNLHVTASFDRLEQFEEMQWLLRSISRHLLEFSQSHRDANPPAEQSGAVLSSRRTSTSTGNSRSASSNARRSTLLGESERTSPADLGRIHSGPLLGRSAPRALLPPPSLPLDDGRQQIQPVSNPAPDGRRRGSVDGAHRGTSDRRRRGDPFPSGSRAAEAVAEGGDGSATLEELEYTLPNLKSIMNQRGTYDEVVIANVKADLEKLVLHVRAAAAKGKRSAQGYSRSK